MKNTFKKIAASVMAVVTMSVGTISITVNATADANTGNTYITNFTVPNASMDWRKYTGVDGIRSKTNATPVYLYPYSGTVSINVRTYGCTRNSFAVNETLNGNAQSVDAVYCTIGNEYAIRSNIYEDGYRYAGLEFRTTSSYSGTTLGAAWSPDSIFTDGMEYAY